jgi:hypothetical protein
LREGDSIASVTAVPKTDEEEMLAEQGSESSAAEQTTAENANE